MIMAYKEQPQDKPTLKRKMNNKTAKNIYDQPGIA